MIDTKSIWTSAWRGIWSGMWDIGAALCNLSTYSAGDPIPFVDDGSGNFVPATGPTKFKDVDGLTATFAQAVDLATVANCCHTVDIVPRVGIDNTDYIWRLLGAGGVSILNVFYQTSGETARINWFESDGATLKGTLSVPSALLLDVRATLDITTDNTNGLSLSVNGGATSNDPIRSAGASVATTSRVGYNNTATLNIFADFYGLYSDAFGMLNLDTRLWLATDPNGNTFITDNSGQEPLNNGTVFTWGEGGLNSNVSPYIGNWPTEHLVSDNACSGAVVGINLIGIYSSEPWTMQASYVPQYVVYDANLVRYPSTGVYTDNTNILSPGLNQPTINKTINSIPYSKQYDISLADQFLINITDGDFSYLLAEANNSATTRTLSGGGDDETLPSANVLSSLSIDYIGAMGAEGDYEYNATFTDPNGDVFTADNDGDLNRYAPYVFITEVDGNTNVEDAQPLTTKTSITVKYIKGANTATNAQGQPIYDENGAIGWTGGQEISVVIDLDIGDNDITSQIINISDDFINLENAMNQINIEAEETQALPLKVHTYTTDEFLMLDSQLGLTEENTNDAGTLVMNYRAAPTYNDNTNDIYHTAEALSVFNSQSPLMGNTSVLGSGQCIYFDRTGFGEDLFKTDKEWAISLFWESTSTHYICGRGAGNNGTSLWVSGNALNVSVGGTDFLVDGSFDRTKPHSAQWKQTFNGSAWADELWVDGVKKYTNRTTNRGTANGDAPASIGCVYGVANVTDPVTDAISGNGDSEVMGFRLSSTAPVNDREMSGLFYREKKYFINLIGGDSIAAGQNGTPYWWQSTRDNAESLNYRTQWVNTAVAGETCYSGMAITPATGFASKPSWVTAFRPAPEANQSIEYNVELFDPDRALISFSSNEFTPSADYTVYNASGTGSAGAPATLGYNGPADEVLYCHKAMEAKFAEYSIPMLWTSTHPVNDSTLITVDDVPRNEVHAIVSDTFEADTNLDNVVIINRSLREGEALYDYNPAYYDDGIHPNTLGHAKDTELIEGVSNPVWEATRDTHFDPEVIITYPMQGQIIGDDPVDVLYTTDGFERSKSEDVDLGENTVVIDYTNPKGRLGSDSVTFDYSDEPQFGEDIRYLMDQVVSNQFIDIASPSLNANVFGTETITGSQWDLDSADSDYAYAVGSEDKMDINSEWAMSIFIERSNDLTSNMRVVGKYGNSSGKNTGLTVVSNNLGLDVAGSFSLLESGFPSSLGRVMLGIQNRDSGGGVYVIDYYLNGVFVSTHASRGTQNHTALPIMYGCKVFSDTDPEDTTTEHFDGLMDNHRYFDKILTTQDWIDLYNNDV